MSETKDLARITITKLKDNEFRDLVDNLVGVSRVYSGTQKLRDKISVVLHATLKPYADPDLRTKQRGTDLESFQSKQCTIVLEVNSKDKVDTILEETEHPDMDDADLLRVVESIQATSTADALRILSSFVTDKKRLLLEEMRSKGLSLK